MAIILRIEGAENIVLGEHSIQTCRFLTETPDDCNARSTDVVNTLLITGKILRACSESTKSESRPKLNPVKQ